MNDMNNGDFHPRDSKLLICLYSDPNFLALNILEILLAKNCVIKIISDDIQKWKERTSKLNSPSRFSVIGTDEYKNLADFSYAIFCGGFLNKDSGVTDFKKFISNKHFGNAKTLALFPFETFSLKTNSKIAISDNAAIIYLGDLLGPRIDLDSDLLLPSLVNEMVIKRSVTLAVGEVFYPIFIADAAKTIVKWLLSFGPYGKDTFLLGRQVSSGDFWKQNLKSFPDLKVEYDTNIETRFVPKGYDTVILNSNLNICLNETYRWLIQYNNDSSKAPRIVSPKKVKIRKPSKFRFLKPYLLPAFIILFFPLITSAISIALLFFSYKQFIAEDINGAERYALLAKTVFVIGKGESNVLAYVPVLGRIYSETSFISYAGETLSDITFNSIPMVESGRQIIAGVLGTGVYDIKTPSAQIKSGLNYAYQQLAYFQIVTNDKASSGILSAKQMLQVVDFDKLKNLAEEGSILSDNLPSILGQGVEKSYLILFENNMELRPTGGFIGSYGVANFGQGNLNGLNIDDIYSADGQLKGHVEPPAPIKNYLGEANWWFRDSNWDPDFPTSAQRAEWFLGKEMNQQVDGVVAIDLELIKEILNYTGPIFLPDYNLTVTSQNLYEKTQEEAQANFFPGSRQKASFLTALSRELISQIPKMNAKNRMLVLKSFYDSLTARHIQIYLHDQNSEDAIDSLGWDGKIKAYSCGDNCYSDFFGDVEANVGVNKSNYFINRKLYFNANIDTQKITRQLTVSLDNTANPSLGPSGIYKTYIRIMIPSDANVVGIRDLTGQSKTTLQPDITQESGRQEVGAFVQVTPGETSDIEFEWENDIPQNSNITSYGLFVRKQAGVGADPITVKFDGIGHLVSSPAFSLTGSNEYSYNTVLDKDLFARLSW